MPSTATSIEVEKSLHERFGITTEEMRVNIKPLFMLMLDHGMSSIMIAEQVLSAWLQSMANRSDERIM